MDDEGGGGGGGEGERLQVQVDVFFLNLWETFFKTVFRWRMEELAEQARLSPVDFRAELTSRLKEDNFSDSLENLLEDVDDDEEEEGDDSVESYNE